GALESGVFPAQRAGHDSCQPAVLFPRWPAGRARAERVRRPVAWFDVLRDQPPDSWCCHAVAGAAVAADDSAGVVLRVVGVVAAQASLTLGMTTSRVDVAMSCQLRRCAPNRLHR